MDAGIARLGERNMPRGCWALRHAGEQPSPGRVETARDASDDPAGPSLRRALPGRARPHRWTQRPARPLATLFALLIASLIGAQPARGDTLRELVRIEGESRSEILGLGLVVGLPGTGDSGKEHPAARVVAEVLRNMGNPIAELEELSKSKTAALVMVTCEIPAGGGRVGDVLDVRVSVMHTATDISGGTLLVAPLRGPLPGQGVYGFARGEVTVEDARRPTVGIVRQGAQLVRDLMISIKGPSFNLVLQPAYAGHASSSEIAGRINDSLRGRPDADGPAIATAVDDRIIRIDIPPAEREHLTPFIADVLSTQIDLSTLRLPARVVVNRRTGNIVMTGDVRISPVRITHKDLIINVTVPPIEPTQANPQTSTQTWANVATRPRESQLARLQDLDEALSRLRIPVQDQIEILHQLKNMGALHAELIIDGD